MSFLETFREMVVILFAIATGYGCRHLGYLGGEINRKLSGLLLNVTIPCLILSSVLLQETRPTPEEIRSVLVIGAAFYGVTYLFTFLVPLLLGGTEKQKGVWRFFLAFSNIGFIGYPLVTALFGKEGFFYAVILGMPTALLNYTLGPLLLSGTLRFRWKQFCTPPVIASVASLVITLADIRLPALAGEMTDLVGGVTIPLSLLLLGSMLAELPKSNLLGSPRIWILSALRLLVMPGVLALVLHLLGADGLIAGVAVAQMAMPVSVNGSMMCLNVNGDTEAMARSIFLTTVLAIVTIPLAAAWFM